MTGRAQREVVHLIMLPFGRRWVFLPSKLTLHISCVPTSLNRNKGHLQLLDFTEWLLSMLWAEVWQRESTFSKPAVSPQDAVLRTHQHVVKGSIGMPGMCPSGCRQLNLDLGGLRHNDRPEGERVRSDGG